MSEVPSPLQLCFAPEETGSFSLADEPIGCCDAYRAVRVWVE
jgi:hypothetical protein